MIKSICCKPIFYVVTFIIVLSVFITPIIVYANPEGEAEAPAGDTLKESEPAGEAPDENQTTQVCHTENASSKDGTETPANNRICPEDSICFATFTKKMCDDTKWTWKSTGTEENQGICIASRTGENKYSFTLFVGAWVKRYLLPVGLSVALILIMAAGILFMLSGTDPGKDNLAKDLIYTSIGGLIFIFLAEVIMGLIVK